MSPAGKRAVLIGGIVAMVAIVVAGFFLLTGGGNSAESGQPDTTTANAVLASTPTAAAQQYLAAFDTTSASEASVLTDNPQDASVALSDAWNTLHPVQIQTTLGTVDQPVGNTATAHYSATWTFNQGHPWTYDGTFAVVQTEGSWIVHWTPAVLEPSLQAGQRLALVTSAPNQTAVLDADGKPLVTSGAGGAHLADADFAAIQAELLQQAPRISSDVFAIQRVDSAGHVLQTLAGGVATVKPLVSTLSSSVQAAAKSTVDDYSGPAVIVVLRPSTGGLLAVAQNAQSEQAGASPFSGLYPPGSTFKIVTATAAMEAGIATPSAELACPATAQIGTRTLSNEGKFDLGTVPLTTAFAKSCNTTFGALAGQLSTNSLASTASQYGLNADFAIPGLTTQTGKVGPAANHDEQVEDGIGQGTVLVSPFGEALMAATVAEGHAVTPQLWQNDPTSVSTSYHAPPASVLAKLRPMMRAVVTSGTATGLAGSGTVYGKTGTAQFGPGDNDNHGWFTGYRGDLAFAVFLQGAGSSAPAVTVAARFLSQLN